MRRNSSRGQRYSREHQQSFCSLWLACTCLLCCVLQATAQHTITLRLEHVAGNAPLETATPYTNAQGEVFTVRNFKYYLSGIVLYNGAANQAFPAQYFLVDEADSASKQLLLPTGLPRITAIGFTIGVDSLANVSGVQTGALDPAKGMFWTWNTGYVMAKLEGTAPVAQTPKHGFSFHVGGFAPGEQAARAVLLQLSTPADCSANGVITISADILRWFSGKHTISIAATPRCHEPGQLAMQLADNYANMFSIKPAP